MSAIQLLLTSGVFLHEVVPFIISKQPVEVSRRLKRFDSLLFLVSLRLVCKEWNDYFVNASDFWHQFMINNLENAMKARGNDEKVGIEFPIECPISFMLNCIRNSSLASKTITKLTSSKWDSYKNQQTLVAEPAILNEFNNVLISEMIRLVSPFIFIENCKISTGSYDQSNFSINFTISNTKQTTTAQLTKLFFKIYRCDYTFGNGELFRSIKITRNEDKVVETEIVLNENPEETEKDKKRVTKLDKKLIKEVMEKIGLSREMIDSDECVREFLYMIYHKGFEKVFVLATCERDLFEID